MNAMPEKAERRIYVAVDIGGTFTDFCAVDLSSGEILEHKSLTTPADPSIGFLNVIKEASERYGFPLDAVAFVFHGTTIATNAVLERKLPRGVLLTTRGFRDVLEIGRHARNDIYSLKSEKKPPLIGRPDRLEIDERVDASGDVVVELDRDSVEPVIEYLTSEQVGVVAISLLHSFRNPVHEKLVRELLTQRLPHLMVSISSEVCPEIREYERTSTTVINALLEPVVRNYTDNLRKIIGQTGLNCPILLIQSNGGATSLESAGKMPSKLLLSGPCGGTLALERLAKRHSRANLVGLDVGGTSSDIALVQEGRCLVINESQVHGHPIRTPMIDVRTVAAGGGSIARLDAGRRLQVGPTSAGSDPGPACYGRGGVKPTVTDANLLLGRLSGAAFLGGTMPLHEHLARRAFETELASSLGRSVRECAEGVIAVVTSNMATAIRLSMFERGLDPADFVLVAFGGGGGLHGIPVAEIVGLTSVLFPVGASTLSAAGMLTTDIVHDFSQSVICPLTEASLSTLLPVVGQLVGQSRETAHANGFSEDDQHLTLQLDLRYRGQGSELSLDAQTLSLDISAIASLTSRYHALHRSLFSHALDGETPEVVTIRLRDRVQFGSTKAVQPVVAQHSGGDPGRDVGTRTIVFASEEHASKVYQRGDIGPLQTISGPAVIEEAYTTIVISPGWTASKRPGGDILASKEGHPLA